MRAPVRFRESRHRNESDQDTSAGAETTVRSLDLPNSFVDTNFGGLDFWEHELLATPTLDLARNMDLLIPIWKVLIRPEFVWGYSAVILLYAVFFFVRLLWRARTPRKSLKQAGRRLRKTKDQQQFTAQYKSIDAYLRKRPALEHPWREFTEQLLIPQHEDDARKDVSKEGELENDATKKSNARTKVIKNTQEASAYFNESSIVRPWIDVRFYSSIPNHLTGLGILGTFLGLAAGVAISSVTLSKGITQPPEMNKALTSLLQGASLAFVTSIAGLFTSFVFLLAERVTFARLQKWIDEFVVALDERLQLVTVEAVQAQELEELKKHTAELKMFNSDLAVAIGGALDSALEKRLAPTLDKMLATLESAQANQSATNEELLDKAIKDLGTAVTGAAGKELANLGETLQALDGRLQASSTALRTQEEAFAESASRISRSLQEGLTEGISQVRAQLDDSLQSIVGAVHQATQSLSEEMTQSGARASASVEDALGRINTAMESLGGVVTTADALRQRLDQSIVELHGLGETMASSHQEWGAMIPTIRAASESFRESGETIAHAGQDISATTKATQDQVAELREAQEDIRQSWEDYSSRFTQVDQSLERVFIQINEGLEAYTTQVRNFSLELDREMSKSITALAGVVSELQEVLDEFPRPGETVPDA